MFKRLHFLALAGLAAALSYMPASADQAKNILDIKSSITDSNIIYPESYELDTQKLRESWYLKNYTATDDRYRRQGDTNVSDDVIKERLAKLHTVVELPFNQIVRSYIDRYTAKGRGAVSALLGLSIYYMPIFEQALEEEGLPLELKYLPVIESGLNPNAVSKHGATGLWQFMLATGKGLDMEISSLVDERRDPYLSSKKAAQYLKELYSSYGDWTLAIAAYNCGPGNLNKAIRRAGGDPSSHDFWSVYYYLPEETRGYVPMFIAANYVMNYYEYHNISPVLATKPLVTDTLMISDRVHFDQIASVLDIPVDQLRLLNPQFRADVIPGSDEKAYTLVLPSQQCHAYIMSRDDILAYEADKYARRTEAQPGDKPSDAVKREIEQENATQTPTSTNPASQPNAESQPVTAAKPASAAAGEMKTVSHKVEPGETLTSISEAYAVTPDQIKDWNSLSRNSLRVGQMLRITTTAEIADASGAKVVSSSTTAAATKPKEQATATAQKKNTSSSSSSKKTASTSSSKKTSSSTAKTSSHTVKSGENLTVIAKKYGTTVAEIKKANGLKNDNIRAGQTLKVPAAATKSSTKSKKKK